jgi:hypothetical protein
MNFNFKNLYNNVKSKSHPNTHTNSNTNENHHIIIRHFKTKNDKIDYTKCYEEAIPYIKFIKAYIEKNNITEIEFNTSTYDRTLMTSLILFIELSYSLGNNYNIAKPIVNKYLERQTNHMKQQVVVNHFKSKYKTKGKLIISVTHSSIYLKVFTGLIIGMNEGDVDIDSIAEEKHIHSHSLSYLTDGGDEVKYGFNIKME